MLDHAIRRAAIEADEIEDFVLGTVLGAGTAGMNLGRNSVFAAGAPLTGSGQTLDRQCASARWRSPLPPQIVVDGMNVVAAGGRENISAVQDRYLPWVEEDADPNVVAKVPQPQATPWNQNTHPQLRQHQQAPVVDIGTTRQRRTALPLRNLR